MQIRYVLLPSGKHSKKNFLICGDLISQVYIHMFAKPIQEVHLRSFMAWINISISFIFVSFLFMELIGYASCPCVFYGIQMPHGHLNARTISKACLFANEIGIINHISNWLGPINTNKKIIGTLWCPLRDRREQKQTGQREHGPKKQFKIAGHIKVQTWDSQINRFSAS